MTRQIGRWVGIGGVTLVIAFVALVAMAFAVGKATIAPLSGRLPLRGLAGPVEIVRDREAVPHIFGNSLDDLYAALGFAHAQDRMWQMELLRRASQGRLSELFGKRTLGTDIFMRTLDLYGHANRALAALTPEHRASLEAYARGVNAFLERPISLLEPGLQPEFLLLRHRPEPWRPADSIAVLKIMALNLSTNFEHEITRLTYAAQGLGPSEIEDLKPPQDRAAAPLPDVRRLYKLNPLSSQRSSAAEADDLITGGASNNWVVSGTRTRTGAPLLANDPHLHLSAPSTWYLAHLALATPGETIRNAAGATLPGTPLIVLGRGDSIAWGFTNTGADVQDLFIEKINPANPEEYLTPEGWRPFAQDRIEIVVKGDATRTVIRRRTRHGPVLPGTYRNLGAMLGPGQVAALQWTALSDTDTTIAAGMFDPSLRTVAGYMAHMRPYVVPMQSMVVADTNGSIGLIAPGRVPVRDPQNRIEGRLPAPGWDAAYDWKGFLPFLELPRVENPAGGGIGTANASIVGPGYAHMITRDWDAPYRQQRIDKLVLSRGGHDLDSMRAAQLDVHSPAIARLKPLMLAAARKRGGDAATLDQLAAWGDDMRADAAEPLIFMAWMRETVIAIYQDDLGDAFPRFLRPHASALIRLLEGGAAGRDWCDDRMTAEHETCGIVLARALKTAITELERRYGTDRAKWTWGAAHFAFNEHRPFGMLRLIGRFFNIEVPSPGGPYTLNRGQVDFSAEPPFANRGAATFRGIYDLSDLDNSLYIHATGQSGNVFSPYYRSFAERWSTGGYIRIPTRRDQIDRAAIGVWTLTPQ